VPEKQSFQNTGIYQIFHLSWYCKHNK